MTAGTPDPIARLDALAERHQTPCGAGGMVWRAWGAGAPLVLFHGASGAWTHWIRNIEPLARRFRVWALDLPGFGDSDDCPEPQTADTLADVVAAGLDVLVPPPARVDFGGFSFGGIIAGLVAARLDARVRALVLIGAGGMGFRRETPLPELVRAPRGAPAAEVQAAHRENLRRLMFGDPAAADDLSVRIHADNLPRARFKSGSIPQSDVLLRALPGVTARLVGIWGERDAYGASFLHYGRDTLARFQPDLDFHVVPGAGHWLIYEAADRVNAALLEILGACPGRRSPP